MLRFGCSPILSGALHMAETCSHFLERRPRIHSSSISGLSGRALPYPEISNLPWIACLCPKQWFFEIADPYRPISIDRFTTSTKPIQFGTQICQIITSTLTLLYLLGTGHASKSDEFSEKFQRGGGSFSFQSKNLYCRFWTLIKVFVRTSWEDHFKLWRF